MTVAAQVRASGEDAPRLVWDWPLRLAHWGLALAVAGALASGWLGTSAFRIHATCGCTALVLVLFRTAWGFVGPRHARFADFVRGPRAVAASLATLRPATYHPYAGHTPLGGWMVLALLALVAVQAGLGLFANDEISHTGPLYGYIDGHLSNRLSAWHVRIAVVIAAAAALHVAAAAYYRYVLGADLVSPMLSGYKRGVGAEAAIESHRSGLAIVILAALVALLGWLLATAPEATLDL